MTATQCFTGQRLFKLSYLALGLILLALTSYTLWALFYSPVYGDETYWKLMVARLVSDDGNLVYLFAQCAQGQWIKAPLSWLPAMGLSSLLYENASHPWVLRLYGWFLYVLLLPVWVLLLKRHSGLGWLDSALAVCAFFSVGVLPFLMVYDRPEKSLLVLLTIVLLLAPTSASLDTKQARSPASFLKIVFWVAFFGLISALLAGIHPKGLFFFPVLLAVLYLRTRSWLALVLLLGLMAWVAQETMSVWQQRTNCPEFPGLMKTLQNLTLRPANFFSDPVGFIKAAWANVLSFNDYVDNIALMPKYVENWLPAEAGVAKPSILLMVLNGLNWVVLGVAGIVIVMNLVRARMSWYGRTGLVWLALALALATIVCLQTSKNFYEAGLIWPLAFLVTVCSFGTLVEPKHRRLAGYLIMLLTLIAISSSVARIERFRSDVPNWIAERTEQQQQMDRHNRSLQEFAKRSCGIGKDAVRLAIDLKTYSAFWQHRQPIFLDYASGWWASEADLNVTLRDRKSEGLIGECERLPADLRARSRAQGEICCLSAEDLR